MRVWQKFALILLAAVVGNGLGAWNLRALAQGRYITTGILTFGASMIGSTTGREIARDRWLYTLAWALGSTIGEVGSIYMDTHFFTQVR